MLPASPTQMPSHAVSQQYGSVAHTAVAHGSHAASSFSAAVHTPCAQLHGVAQRAFAASTQA